MTTGPLDDPRLREVEACLNEGRFEEAQRKLMGLGSKRELEAGVAYLTTRLLAQRGRLDATAIAERMDDLLSEAPNFPEARNYLASVRPPAEAIDLGRAPTVSSRLAPNPAAASVAPPQSIRYPRDVIMSESPFPEPPTHVGSSRQPRPSTLETPRVPGPLTHAAPGQTTRRSSPPGRASDRPTPLDLGVLEPPRSELPTEPAPPPSEPLPYDLLRFEHAPGNATGRGVWDPVELDLASGRVEAALSALEKQAGLLLDQLVLREMPDLGTVAEHAADFLGRAPIACHFPAYDLSLGSLARLDAALGLFARRPQRAPRYALSVLLSAYVGECVRRASGGRWEGRLAEPDMATIERPRGETYMPWRAVHQAMTEGRPLRMTAGVSTPPGPAVAQTLARRPTEPLTAWDPEPWPDFSMFQLIGRVVPGSVLGTWAARIVQVPLDRSLASLVAIDQYLGLLAQSAMAPDASGGWARRAAVLAGAYTGEVLCLNTGARWSENTDAPFGPLRFELVTPDGGAAYPVLWMLERLRGQARLTVAERARQLLTA